MPESGPYHAFELMAADVRVNDRLVDRLSKKPFMWPNGSVCPGTVGPFTISATARRGPIVELTVLNGDVHLHHFREMLLVYREAQP